jgi:DNA-binding GntR family transcriptional regulator
MVHDLLALDQGMSNLIPIEILRSRVAREIRAAILRGELAPGSHVKQEELAAQLGVSREPVRQALLVLQREGLVLAQPNRRAMVAPLDRQLINDVYGFREAVETTVVAMLARLPAFDVTPLREIIARGRAAVGQGDLSALLHLDMIFHTTMYEAAGNRVIVEVMHGQWSHIRRLLEMVLGRANYRQKVWDEHEAIVNEIAARRVAAARNVSGRHIRSARRMLLSVFGTTSAATSAARGRRDAKLTP